MNNHLFFQKVVLDWSKNIWKIGNYFPLFFPWPKILSSDACPSLPIWAIFFAKYILFLVWILQYCQFPDLISTQPYSSANSQMKLKLINIWYPNIWNPQMNLNQSKVELSFEMQRLQVCNVQGHGYKTLLELIFMIQFLECILIRHFLKFTKQ